MKYFFYEQSLYDGEILRKSSLVYEPLVIYCGIVATASASEELDLFISIIIMSNKCQRSQVHRIPG